MITITAGEGILSAEDAARIAATARSGGTIVFPTDTFYALGANPASERGVERVFALKGRERSRPLLLLLDSADRAELFAASVSREHRLLMDRFWPGPLTLLFRARGALPQGVVSRSGEIALRVPGSPLCRFVLTAAGGVLTGTSANRSGESPAADLRSAVASLTAEPDLGVDGGTSRAQRVSTLLRLEKGGAVVVREGAISLDEVRSVLAAERRVHDATKDS